MVEMGIALNKSGNIYNARNSPFDFVEFRSRLILINLREEAGVYAGLDLGGSSFDVPFDDATREEDRAGADDESGHPVSEVRHRTSDQGADHQ